jgi:phosphoribosylanthranilate isomerase
MLVQIYEVSTPEEASALSRIGVDHIGVLVGKGKFPREQSYAATRQIFAAVSASAKKLSLSLADHVEELAEVVEETRPDLLHLGTRPEALLPSQVAELKASFAKLKIMRTIPVRDENDIAIARTYEGIADFLLLDTWKSGEPEIGACGLVHDWAISRSHVTCDFGWRNRARQCGGSYTSRKAGWRGFEDKDRFAGRLPQGLAESAHARSVRARVGFAIGFLSRALFFMAASRKRPAHEPCLHRHDRWQL